MSCCVKAATVMKCLGQARSWDMPYHILSCPRKCLGPARSWDRPALGTCPVKYCKMLDNAWDRPALGTCRAVAEGGFVSRACMLELPMHALLVFCFLSCCFCVSEALPYSSTMTTWAGSWWPQVSDPPNVEGKELEGSHASAAENEEGKDMQRQHRASDRY